MTQEITGAGLMSGTSLDGLDIACCKFTFNENEIMFSIAAAETIPYNTAWKNKLSAAHGLSGYDLMLLNREFGKYCGECVNDFLQKYKTHCSFIASHGHTIFHQPKLGISTQIGSASSIVAATGITTICDFRSLDVELGGQGAPLVPIGDELLFGEYEACLNLGGIANISFRKNNERIAFDICSVNITINWLAAKLGLPMDVNGEIARNANVNPVLFQNLNMNPFYALPDKKSLGREWIEEHILRKVEASKIRVEDKIRTLTEHSAFHIAQTIKKNALNKILVTGGGAYNSFLIERIRELSGAEIILPSKEIIEFKEALIFALLGALRLRGASNTLKSVTGARVDSCGGAVYLGK